MPRTTHTTDGNEQDHQDTRDPAQLAPPRVDTGMRLLGPFTVDLVIMLVPAFILFFVTILGFFAGFGLASIGLAFLTVVVGALGLWAISKTGWHEDPLERFGRRLESRMLRDSGIWSHEDGIEAALHGVRSVFDDGTIEMSDGRFVALYRVRGVNTAQTTDSETDNFAADLSKAFDEYVHPNGTGHEVGFYSGTFGASSENLATEFEDAARSDQLRGPSQAPARELLYDTAEWLRTVDDETWRDAGWRHYAIVEADERDVELDENADDEGRLWSLSDLLRVRTATREHAELRRRIKHDAVRRRLDDPDGAGGIADALRSASLDGEHVEPPEVALVLCRYFTGDDHRAGIEAGAVVDRLLGTADANTDANGEDKDGQAQHRALVPGGTDPTNVGHLRLDEQYTRTYWIADWPEQARSMFLRKLYTSNDLDADVRLRFAPEDKGQIIEDLESHIPDIGAEGSDRGRESDLAASDIEEDIDYWHYMRQTLRNTTAQPWRMAGYVAVRADTQDALDEAENSLRDYASLDTAALRALSDDAERVTDALEVAPAECEVKHPEDEQSHVDLFVSASPVARDKWANRTEGRTIAETFQRKPGSVTNPRRRLVLSGMIGASFPPCAGRIHETGGVPWGRNQQNGSLVVADPFARGESPHLITLGKSRSGKTYSTEQGAIRWFLADEDQNRTLILCDTQAGFHGAVEVSDGKHVVVDGSSGINPFDIQPVPEDVCQAIGDRIDPLGLKIGAVTNFIVSLISSQGDDPSKYYPVIEAGVQEVYSRAGITKDLDTHSNPSPTMGDFIDVVGELLDEDPDPDSRWHRAEIVEERKGMAKKLLTRLSSLQPGGRHHYLMSEDEMGLADPDVRMAYLDLQQLRNQDDLEQSAMLMLMLDQVAEKIKRAPGETMFVIDEAHMLLHSQEAVEWLNKAVREWARYDAAIHFVSQSPHEFLERVQADVENKRRTIVDQTSMVRLFDMPKVDRALLRDGLELNATQLSTVRGGLTPGKRGLGYSESLVSFEDRRGWWPIRVEASQFEHAVLTYSPREHGSFSEYIRSYMVEDMPEEFDSEGQGDSVEHTAARTDGGKGDDS